MVAYLVFTREETTDPLEMDIYARTAPDSLAGHSVTPRAFYGAFEMLEGDSIEGGLILEFPSMAEARDWYRSPAYQAAAVHRRAGSRTRIFILEGVS